MIIGPSKASDVPYKMGRYVTRGSKPYGVRLPTMVR